MGKPIGERVGSCSACGKGCLKLFPNQDISDEERMVNEAGDDEDLKLNFHIGPHDKIDGSEEVPCEGSDKCPKDIAWDHSKFRR